MLNHVLQKVLVRKGEGWLSEETVDDFDRLGKSKVWIVDLLDGARVHSRDSRILRRVSMDRGRACFGWRYL
jgi:fructose-1,6-bisphosphatase/inositol monophosphatase family enzyme